MTQSSLNTGFHVLAYPNGDSTCPIPLSLVFRHNNRRAQATLCLLSSLFIHACEEAQIFILQYDADNMVPGAISLGPATIPLPQERLNVIARGNPQIRTLSLTLKKPCPVWCPPSCRQTTPLPRPSCAASFAQLATLAQARELHVVFDYKQLHSAQHEGLQRLVEHADRLSGYPVAQYYRERRYACLDWRVFDVRGGEDGSCGDDEGTTEDEEMVPPPAYARVGESAGQGEFNLSSVSGV
jgi:hypothetical protein